MRILTFFAALLGAFALAIIGTTPPGAVGANAPAADFSAARAMEDVRIISARPHVTGSPENAVVRTHIIGRFEELGMEVTATQGQVPERGLEKMGHWSGTRPDSLTFTNIIATLPGRDRTKPAVLLMAHHDTVWNSPGAPDDTAGIVSIIESLRASSAQGQLERDVVALITDAEELGLVGARQFFAENPLRTRIGAIINVEARGGGGRTTLFQTSRNNGNAVKLYANAVGTPGGSSLATFVYEALPNDTDLTPALEMDVVAYNLSFIGRPGLYHSPKATPDRLDQGSVQDMGQQTLELMRALGGAETLPAAQPNRTFFDLFGLVVIHYGAVVGWLLLALTAALHIFALRTNTQVLGNTNRLWRSVAASLSVIIGGGGLLYALNWLSGSTAPNAYYDRLAATPMLEVQALLICIGILAATAPLWAGRKGSVFGVVIALAAQILAPTTAFIVVFPLLISGLATVIAQFTPKPWDAAPKIIGGALVGGFLLQYGHQLMQGVGPSIPSLTALLAALTLPLLGLLIPAVNARKSLGLAILCIFAATAIALYVRLDPVADTVADYASLKG